MKTPFLAAFVFLVLLPGCVGSTKLNEIEKARLVNQKRKEARDVLVRIKADGARDLQLLERYVQLHQETTEILPSTCPRCWAAYGESLSMIGFYYWYIYEDVLDDIERASPEDLARLEAEAVEYEEEWRHQFTISNQAYEAHFRDPTVRAVHPYTYERVMRHHELMEDFQSALYYLQRCIDSHPRLNDMGRKKYEKLRRLYKREVARQKERALGRRDSSRVRRSDAGSTRSRLEIYEGID